MSRYREAMGISDLPKLEYDVLQVCWHGHLLTAHLKTMPESGKRFCTECGGKAISECPDCLAPIRGAPTRALVPKISVPNNCHACGVPYPWRQAAIANAIEVAQAEVDAAQAEEVEQLVHSIAAKSPRAEADAMKLGKMLSGISSGAREVVRKAFIEIAAEAIVRVILRI